MYNLGEVPMATVAFETFVESPKLQHYLREMLRVMSAASASQSDFNRVLFWFKNVPIPSFNHKTALQLIAEGRTEPPRVL
jgi:hypothetical protein